MDFPPEVLSNLHVLNVQHLRSLEQGQDILANHPRLEDNCSGEPPRKKVAASSETDAGNDTVNGSSAAPATKPMRMSLREQSVAAYVLRSVAVYVLRSVTAPSSCASRTPSSCSCSSSSLK